MGEGGDYTVTVAGWTVFCRRAAGWTSSAALRTTTYRLLGNVQIRPQLRDRNEVILFSSSVCVSNNSCWIVNRTWTSTVVSTIAERPAPVIHVWPKARCVQQWLQTSATLSDLKAQRWKCSSIELLQHASRNLLTFGPVLTSISIRLITQISDYS